MVHTEGYVPALLVGWEALAPHRTGLTILLARHVLESPIPIVELAPAQHLTLWAYQVVAPINEAALGNHVGLLVGMDWDVSGDTPILQKLPELPSVVSGVRRQRHWLKWQPADRIGLRFPSPREAWVTPPDRMNPPRSTITFSW